MTYKCHHDRQLQVGTSVRRNCASSRRRAIARRTPTLPDNDAITRRPTGALPVVTCVFRIIGRRRRPVGMDRRGRPKSEKIVAGDGVCAKNDCGRSACYNRVLPQTAIDRTCIHPTDQGVMYSRPIMYFILPSLSIKLF